MKKQVYEDKIYYYSPKHYQIAKIEDGYHLCAILPDTDQVNPWQIKNEPENDISHDLSDLKELRDLLTEIIKENENEQT